MTTPRIEEMVGSEHLYSGITIKETGVDQDGAFCTLLVEVKTGEKEKTKKEIRLHINGRLWLSNKYDDYAYSEYGTGGKTIIHNPERIRQALSDTIKALQDKK